MNDIEPMAPPHSREAEQSVLGAVMLDQQILDDLIGKLEPSDFYYPQHQVIYQTMLGMNGQPIDVVTVSEVMEQHNEGDRVDLDYLIDLASNTPSTANAMVYAGIVVERSKERQLMAVGQLFNELCHNRELTHEDRIEQAQSAFTALSSEKQPDTQVSLDRSMDAALEAMEHAFELGADPNHIRSGILKVDNRIMGFRPGNLVVIGARPGMGKTTWGLQIIRHCVQHHGKAMVFSLEMPHRELSNRMISAVGSVNMDFIRNPNPKRDEWDGVRVGVVSMKGKPLVIDDQGGLSVAELSSRARREHRKAPLKAIMIDYIQLMNAGKSENRAQEVTKITQGLKNLAKELDCVVIAISQLSRAVESRPGDNRPINSDLRESGSVEQDADIIQFLYRDSYYDEGSSMGSITEIITSKFRDGQPGTDHVDFQGQYNRFVDCDYQKIAQQQEGGGKYEYR
jgi:replicative DNA helicase